MIITDLFESRDICRVCGQTPCNCTHIAENVAEGTGNIGSAIRALYQKIYRAGDDEVEYFYNDSPIFAQYWDEYEGDLDSIIAEVDPAELQIILDELESYVEQAGLAEGLVGDVNVINYTKVPVELKPGQAQIHGWGPDEQPIYRVKGHDGKEVITSNKRKMLQVATGQGVAEMDSQGYKGTRDEGDPYAKGSKATPVKFKNVAKQGAKVLDKAMNKSHPDYSNHEKKLISKMSNAEKVDKGWRNPNIDEGLDKLYPFERTVIDYMQDNSWLSAERAYFRYIGLQKKKQMSRSAWEEEIQRFIDLYNKYKGPQGVAEVSDDTLTSYLTKVHDDSLKHEKDPTKRSPEKRNKSVAGFARAFNKLDARREKTNEVSKDTLGSYVKKAHQDVVDRATSASFQSGQAGDKYNKADTSPKDQQREKGMSRALDRLTRESDSKQPPEADYGDSYQDMVKRVKKLAGLGPLKTVWDPVKRVYRNVPVSTQPK